MRAQARKDIEENKAVLEDAFFEAALPVIERRFLAGRQKPKSNIFMKEQLNFSFRKFLCEDDSLSKKERRAEGKKFEQAIHSNDYTNERRIKDDAAYVAEQFARAVTPWWLATLQAAVEDNAVRLHPDTLLPPGEEAGYGKKIEHSLLCWQWEKLENQDIFGLVRNIREMLFKNERKIDLPGNGHIVKEPAAIGCETYYFYRPGN